MKEKESQSWFLIKEDWSKWLFNLSDEDAGKFIKAIYSKEVPTGVIGVLYQSQYDEFSAINNGRLQRKKRYSDLAKLGNEARWNTGDTRDTKELSSNNKGTIWDNEEMDHDPVESPTLTLTPTHTPTQKVDNKIYTIPEEHKKIDEFWDIENFKIK